MSRSAGTTKSILISGYYGFGNTGDEAILAAIIHQLRQRIPDCHLTVISGNPEWTNRDHADVEAISWLDLTQIISAIEAADLILCGGGGLFHDYWGLDPDSILRSGHWGISFFAEAPLLAALLGKPTMMYGVGVGPLFSDETRRIVKCVFNLAHVITVRDAESKRLLEDIGVESNRVEVTADPAFAVLPEEFSSTTAFWEDKGPRIGVVVRHWDFKVFPGYWERVVAEALDRFLAEVSGQALFIPFQAVEGRQENDRAVIQRVRGQMQHGERCRSLDAPLVPAKMAGLIASCDLVIGMRLHSLVFAITTGVPMAALSYDPKVSSLMNRIEFEQFCMELKDISEEKLLNTLRYAWAMRAESQQRLKVLSTRLRALAERNAELVVNLAGAERLTTVTWDPDTVRVLARIIATQAKVLHHQEKSIRAFQAQVAEREEALETLGGQVAEREAAVQDLQAKLSERERELESLKTQVMEKGSAIEALQAEVAERERELNAIYASKSWRLIWLQWAFRRKLRTLFQTGLLQVLRQFVPVKLRRDLKPAYDVVWHTGNLARQTGFSEELERILSRHRSARDVIVFAPSVEWNLPLFQRPHQLALAFARQGCLVFFCEPLHSADYAGGFHAIAERLYVAKVPLDVLRILESPVVFILTYNKHCLRHFDNARIVYDYIDELDVFPGDRETLERNHRGLLKTATLVVVTAERLHKQVLPHRPDALLCPNGVDYDFIRRTLAATAAPPEDLSRLLRPQHPVVGYYGALAEWFDYELLSYAAAQRPHFDFVLIGPDYDGSIERSRIREAKNVHWLGVRPYEEIPLYLKYFHVAIIPFKLNKVTDSTSPLKLFEYMAGGKPIVTTAMHECQRYPGVLVAHGSAEFIEKLDEALRLRNDAEYLALLDRVARENTWDTRVAILLQALNRGEKA